MRVLVCDDDKLFRRSVIDLLLGEGCSALEASGGLEAIVIARKHPVDFGIFDIQLPDMDGPTALRQLRAEAITFPVVVVSGEPRAAEWLAAITELVAFLPKPPDVRTLRTIVKSFSAHRAPPHAPGAGAAGGG